MATLTPAEQAILDEMPARRPDLRDCMPAMSALHERLVHAYDNGNKLLLCGNGGSHADSIHIAGELCKSFERKRPLPPKMADRLKGMPYGDELGRHLERGLPAIALGCNSALKTAIENDSPLRDMAFAQEAYALAKPGDVLMGLSTSGEAANCLMALTVAKAVGAATVALTGPDGGRMARFADIAVKAPGNSTKTVQEAHIILYHTICGMIEAHYFTEPR
jgi:D-sedoheptulose 7-phosphate isomerase